MQIIRDLKDYIAFGEADLFYALQKISLNKHGIIFTVSNRGILEGLMTDGDFRRYLISVQKADLNIPLNEVASHNYKACKITDPREVIQASFSDRVSIIPLVDDEGHLVAIATQERGGFEIGPFHISDKSKVFVIAEIGINHNGSPDLAKRMIHNAKEVGADCVKFQMRDMGSLYRNHGDTKTLAGEDLGAQYVLDLLAKFHLDQETMFSLFDECKANDILPLCTPWDIVSLEALESYGMEGYKVASADLTNHELLTAMAKTGKPMILSTGMSREDEIIQAVDLLNFQGASYAMLHCNSTYPAPFKDINLNYMGRLKRLGDCPVGYSGHERGIHIPIAAVAQGAVIIEKHFTFDREMEGNDHKVSLLPNEFAAMVEGIRQTEESLGKDGVRNMSQGEMMNRENLAKSLVAVEKIPTGASITREMITIKSPGRGLQPNRLSELLGTKANRDFEAGDFFFEGDLSKDAVRGRPFTFSRPWGVPVRYHDYRKMLNQSNPDFLEIHFSYKDLDLKVEDYFDEAIDASLVVHSPDLFKGDHLLNFAEKDQQLWERSVEELQRVIDVTLKLKPLFNVRGKVPLVVSLGGFTKDKHLEKGARQEGYARIAEGLSKLNQDGVEILAQTLPPFPWYFGGQLFCNLFVEAEDTVEFCETYGYRVCFDISHSKLTCNHYKSSFDAFTRKILPHTGHLHIVDAKGTSGEGIQINEGEVDFPLLSSTLNEMVPDVSFIPEIWQGHKNEGEGFWVALDRLEPLL
jgi:sialic acid synthase SpsE/sugar phosphate isomerase/epimerase